MNANDGSARARSFANGELRAIAPASVTHGIIQANFARLLGTHLGGTACHLVIAPGIIPRVQASFNFRIPDQAVNGVPRQGRTERPARSDPRHPDLVAEQRGREARERLGLCEHPGGEGNPAGALDRGRRRTAVPPGRRYLAGCAAPDRQRRRVALASIDFRGAPPPSSPTPTSRRPDQRRASMLPRSRPPNRWKCRCCTSWCAASPLLARTR